MGRMHTSQEPLRVGSAVAKRGHKSAGFIDVPTGSDPGTRIPVSIIAGSGEGPVLALTAGVHGSEPSPVLALERLRAEVDPKQLSGTMILVHIANVPSFQHRTIYRGPWDQKNLNRVFPGKPDGTASERIAYAITTEVIDRCDYLIDMHSGDGNEDLRPYSYWNHLGVDESVDNAARDLALAFGLDHIVIDRGRPRDVHASVFCSNTAHVRGRPAVTTEAGGLGVPTKDAIAVNVRGVRGVLRHLGMLRSGPPPVKRPVWLEPSTVLTSPGTGLWYPSVRSGAQVRKGARIGHLTDYFGKTVATVKSPMSGIVLYVVASPAMTRDEPVAMIAQPVR